MLKNLSADHIYIVCGHTDMRKSIDGLAAIIQQQYQLDLFGNSAFLFCGRRRDRLKVLLWEEDGCPEPEREAASVSDASGS